MQPEKLNLKVSDNLNAQQYVNFASMPEYRIHRKNFRSPKIANAEIVFMLRLPIEHDVRYSYVIGSDEDKKPIWGFKTPEDSKWKKTSIFFEFRISGSGKDSQKMIESPSWFLELREEIIKALSKLEEYNENNP